MLRERNREKGKVLILIGTHGDEAAFGRKVLKRFELPDDPCDENDNPEYTGIPVFPYKPGLKRRLNFIVANPKAAERRARFVDADLNRVAPGNPESPHYEVRRAAELLEIASGFDRLIDIHCTPTKSGIFAIITNPMPATIALTMALDVRNIVVWPARDKTKGPLTAHHPCALELECGPGNDPRVLKDLVEHLSMSLTRIDLGLTEPANSWRQRWFRVDGKLLATEADRATVAGWCEFELVTHGGDTFYPILLNKTDVPLANSPTYAGVRCHKARPVDFRELFSR